MANYAYRALDSSGRETSGFYEADSAKQVRQYIRDQNLTPLEVFQEKNTRNPSQGKPLMRGKLSPAEVALFTRQLATLVSSGTPLEEALKTIAEHSDKRSTKAVILSVRSGVLEGKSLSASLGQYPAAFDELYQATVEAGEQSSHLEKVLERLADYSEAHQETIQKIRVAMFYPAILLVMAIGIVSGLLTYVVPQVVQVFEGSQHQLPFLTIAILALSDFLKANGLWLLLLLAALVYGYKQLLKAEGFRFAHDRFLLKVPLIKKFIQAKNTVQFTRTLSILASSGVPVLQAMSIAASVVGNRPMRQAVKEAAEKVREGASIYKSLQQSGYFPPMVLHMIASGEKSGELDTMLERAAAFQQKELNSMIAVLVGIFEPVVILVMGVAVLLIVLAILLPIFELNQLIQ